MPLAAERRPAWWVHAQLGNRLGIDVLNGLDPDLADDDSVLRLLIDNFNGVSNVMKVDSKGKGESRTDELFHQLVAAGPHGELAKPQIGWVHEKALPHGRWRLAPSVMIERLPSLLESSLDNSGLRLVNRRLARRVNSASYARTDLAEREPPDIVIHPSDAADLGIEDGASIRVRSEVGSIEGRANLDDKIRRGAVSLTHGCLLYTSRCV